MVNAQIYLNTHEAAERLSLALSTLANWRSAGQGPAYLRAGGRILYPLDQLEAWEAARVVKCDAA